MDAFNSNTIFIDVTQNPEYQLTQDVCQATVDPYNQNATLAVEVDVKQSVELVHEAEIKADLASDDNFHGESSNAVPSQSGTQKKSKKSAAEQNCLSIVSCRVQCPECRYTTETEEKMLRHIKKVHKGENPFQCYMCDYSTYNKSIFEEHVRIHQGIKPFKCSQCEYKSASKKNLKKHTLVHRPNNPLKCGQCDFIARHSQALRRHLESHVEGLLESENCKHKHIDMVAFKKHAKTHSLKCTECNFKTCSRPLLKRHMLGEHGFKDGEVFKDTFTCQVCRWSSSKITRILLHLIHHPKQVVDESVIDISILRKHGIMP